MNKSDHPTAPPATEPAEGECWCANCGKIFTATIKHERIQPGICELVRPAPEAKACEHRNTRFSDIGMRDCLDCGGLEIDYQPDTPPTQSTEAQKDLIEMLAEAVKFMDSRHRPPPEDRDVSVNEKRLHDAIAIEMAQFASEQLSTAKAKWAEEVVDHVQDVMGAWGGPERKVVDGMMAELFKRLEAMRSPANG